MHTCTTAYGYGALTMLVAMFCRAVQAILFALMHSSANKEPYTSDFGVIFGDSTKFFVILLHV